MSTPVTPTSLHYSAQAGPGALHFEAGEASALAPLVLKRAPGVSRGEGSFARGQRRAEAPGFVRSPDDNVSTPWDDPLSSDP
jgi:hypothetical protein